MRINSICANQSNSQKQSTRLNFTALKLGRQNKYVTEETRELADKAVDLYESVVTKSLKAENDNGVGGFIKKGWPLKLQKKINNETVSLTIHSNEPRVADIELDIFDKDNEYYTNYWYNSCIRCFSEREEELFSVCAENPNENETKVFNNLLKEFLNSSDEIIKLFK